MPLFDAISSLFSTSSVTAVTNPSVGAGNGPSGAITINDGRWKVKGDKYGDCGAKPVEIVVEDNECAWEKTRQFRENVLEELRALETESAVKDEEHYAVRESLQERLAHYEKELLKIRHHDVVVHEKEVPVPVKVPVPVRVPVHVPMPVRVPVVHRETRVISRSPCAVSPCGLRGRSLLRGGCGFASPCAARAFSPCAARAFSPFARAMTPCGLRAASPCGFRGCSPFRRSLGAFPLRSDFPLLRSEFPLRGEFGYSDPALAYADSRLDDLSLHEHALASSLTARRPFVEDLKQTLMKVETEHEQEQRTLQRIADDKRRAVSGAFEDLKQRKEAELRREADRMAENIQREQQYVEAKQRTLESFRADKYQEIQSLDTRAQDALRRI